MKVNEVRFGGWFWYFNKPNENESDEDASIGKWMIFYNLKDIDVIKKLLAKAIEAGVCYTAKCKDPFFATEFSGVACFYTEIKNIEGHKKILQYLLDNNLIRRTKKGKLYNISFKFDEQTKNKEYGDMFIHKICLEDFIDIDKEEFRENINLDF